MGFRNAIFGMVKRMNLSSCVIKSFAGWISWVDKANQKIRRRRGRAKLLLKSDLVCSFRGGAEPRLYLR